MGRYQDLSKYSCWCLCALGFASIICSLSLSLALPLCLSQSPLRVLICLPLRETDFHPHHSVYTLFLQCTAQIGPERGQVSFSATYRETFVIFFLLCLLCCHLCKYSIFKMNFQAEQDSQPQRQINNRTRRLPFQHFERMHFCSVSLVSEANLYAN